MYYVYIIYNIFFRHTDKQKETESNGGELRPAEDEPIVEVGFLLELLTRKRESEPVAILEYDKNKGIYSRTKLGLNGKVFQTY